MLLTVVMIIDNVKLCKAGDGGNAVSFVKKRCFWRTDGGDGGNGGNIVVKLLW